jgi:hypothetical protein
MSKISRRVKALAAEAPSLLHSDDLREVILSYMDRNIRRNCLLELEKRLSPSACSATDSDANRVENIQSNIGNTSNMSPHGSQMKDCPSSSVQSSPTKHESRTRNSLDSCKSSDHPSDNPESISTTGKDTMHPTRHTDRVSQVVLVAEITDRQYVVMNLSARTEHIFHPRETARHRSMYEAIIRAYGLYGDSAIYHVTSEFIVSTFQRNIHRWLANDFTTKNGEKIYNEDLIRTLHNMGIRHHHLQLMTSQQLEYIVQRHGRAS